VIILNKLINNNHHETFCTKIKLDKKYAAWDNKGIGEMSPQQAAYE